MSVINGIHPSVNTVYICSKERSIDSPSMPKERVVLDSDLRYLDGKGVLLRTRTELTVARILSFLGRRYEYDSVVSLKDGKKAKVDFKTDDKYIEVVDSEEDARKLEQIRTERQDISIVGLGPSKIAARVDELDSFFLLGNAEQEHTGSIFIEDPSLAFDYAHI